MSTVGTKKDYLVVSLIGFFFGILLLPILWNVQIPSLTLNTTTAVFIVIGFVFFANAALALAFALGHALPILPQIAKFAATGALNTVIDLGILSILIFASGVTAGVGFALWKALSFTAAVLNSYYLNRYWTFEAKGEASAKEFGGFLFVSVLGIVVNVSVASFFVSVVGPLGGTSAAQWATVSALAATVASLAWNFFGYKLFVFKKREPAAL